MSGALSEALVTFSSVSSTAIDRPNKVEAALASPSSF
eukprot:SAG31_NODE_2211_length_6179_cov_2.919572_2_plen_37_part_00